MTESSPVLTFPTLDTTNTGTVGVLVPNTEARVIDINSGDNLTSGVSGELCFKGPQVRLISFFVIHFVFSSFSSDVQLLYINEIFK